MRGDLLTTGRLRHSAIFRRNISLTFGGQKESIFDSDDTKLRKECTRKRCEIIRGLSPDAVVSWAIAYAPTLWAGGSMASDVFDCLVDDIEPKLALTWPSVIKDTLYKLREDETLCELVENIANFFKVS